MTTNHEARISRIRDLLEPLRRSTFEEARETNQAWRQDTYGIVAAALGCSTSELMQLTGSRRVSSLLVVEGPQEEWDLSERQSVSVLLPLGVLDKYSRRPEWLEITRYRWPRTPLHTWRLQRKYALNVDTSRPNLTHSGWYQAELTSQTVAIACQKSDLSSPQYRVRYERVKWTDDGERAGVAPSDSQRIVERVEELTQMLIEDRPRYRLQVRKESWPLNEEKSIDRWGYRIVGATGRVEDAASSGYSDLYQTDHEQWFATRASAIGAGQGRIRYLLENNYRETGWDDVKER